MLVQGEAYIVKGLWSRDSERKERAGTGKQSRTSIMSPSDLYSHRQKVIGFMNGDTRPMGMMSYVHLNSIGCLVLRSRLQFMHVLDDESVILYLLYFDECQ